MPHRFRVDRLDKELLVRVPRPSSLQPGETPSLPYWDLAGKRLALQVIAPNDIIKLDTSIIGVKLLYGRSIEVQLDDGSWEARELSPPAKQAGSTLVPSGATVRTGDEGAVMMTVAKNGQLDGPFTSMDQIETKQVVPAEAVVEGSVADADIPWVKVQDLKWGKTGHWDGLEFYNATGFSLYFGDDGFEWICHTQAWTCGLYETAKFHLHNVINFCEIHMTLNNSGGTSGMRYFTDEFTPGPDFNRQELQKDFVEENSKLLVIPDMYEQGGFWKIQPGNKFRPILTADDMVDYPWHGWIGSDFGSRGEPPVLLAESGLGNHYDVWLAFEIPSTRFQY